MPLSFWSNTIWYVLLLITSIASMVFTLIKSKNRKYTFASTLAILGLLYLIEAILVIFLHSYSYSPKLNDNTFHDTVFGNMFSQISLSSTSALSIVYGLSYGWYFVFAAIYFMIEELFVMLGIYHHFWYKSIYTFIGFIPLFWGLKIWQDKLATSSKYFINHTALLLSVVATNNLIMLPMRLLDIQNFTVNFYGEFAKDSTLFSIFYSLVLINILILLYRWRTNFIWKGIVFIVLFCIQYVLYKSGIIYYKNGWFLIATIFDFFGFYFWVIVLDRFLRQKPKAT